MPGSPIWNVERMRPVVAEWDAALRAEVPAYARLVPEAEQRGSVLRPPACEADVAALEARRGTTLPPSYRSFLLISNGADADGFGANRVERLFDPGTHALVGAQDVRAFADDEFLAWLVEMWRETSAEFAGWQEPPTADAPAQVHDFEPGSRAVLVTEPIQDGTVGLVPFEGEWQVWELFHTEVLGHQSFATYLVAQARDARRRVAERAERVRAAAADGSSAIEIEDLAWHGDPRAVDAACRALLRDPHTDGLKRIAAHELVRLGDPSAVPPLRTALEQVRDRRSRAHLDPPGYPADNERDTLERLLLMALDSCGDPDIVAELERLAPSESPVGRHAAAHLERRDGLPRW